MSSENLNWVIAGSGYKTSVIFLNDSYLPEPFLLKLMLVNTGMQIHTIFAHVLPMQANVCG